MLPKKRLHGVGVAEMLQIEQAHQADKHYCYCSQHSYIERQRICSMKSMKSVFVTGDGG